MQTATIHRTKDYSEGSATIELDPLEGPQILTIEFDSDPLLTGEFKEQRRSGPGRVAAYGASKQPGSAGYLLIDTDRRAKLIIPVVETIRVYAQGYTGTVIITAEPMGVLCI